MQLIYPVFGSGCCYALPQHRLAGKLTIAQAERDQLFCLRCGASAFDEPVLRRERAGGIGGGRVAGEVKGLTATAAEIDRAPIAALARFGHPGFTAERVEGARMVPDVLE